MLFNSFEFLLFFPIVVCIYYLLPQKVRYIWLLVASYYFYMSWNAKYIFLIMGITVIAYISAYILDSIKENSLYIRRTVLSASIIVELCFLFYFKYSNFAINILNKIDDKIGIDFHIDSIDILLPVGISFYTFQTIGYIIDIYRNEVKVEKNIFKFALFVSFFPQLVAGPIERSGSLLKQINKKVEFSYKHLQEGTLLIFWGLFLKIVLADRISIFVDKIYGDYTNYSGWFLIVATVVFAFQIYCDFAGYSTIAMGTAKILGIELMDNFNAPYLSLSVNEFWRRWHISLTSWFKDYLYIPLGGSRKGIIRKYINKMIVFLVSGAWHGAQFSYIAWGAINGVYLLIEDMSCDLCKKKKMNSTNISNKTTYFSKIFRILITFILIDFSWIFFRAKGLSEAIEIVKRMFRVKNPWILFDGSLYKCGLDQKNFNIMIFGIVVLLFADWIKKKNMAIRDFIIRENFLIRCIVIDVAIIILLVFGIWGSEYNANNFIYFQF